MLRKKFKIAFTVFSLLVLAGCNEGPKVTVCILDSKNDVLQCRDPKGKVFALTMKGADNYVCMSPDDTEAVLNYCKRK